MDNKTLGNTRLVIGLITIVCVLQALIIGLILHFGINGLETGALLEDRTSRMISKDFPQVIKGVSDISDKTSRMRSDISDIKRDMGQVGEKMDSVASNVGSVKEGVTGLRSDLSQTLLKRSWLMWGNAVNPYLLMASVLIIALGVLFLCIRRFGKGRVSPSYALEAPEGAYGWKRIQDRMDKLIDLLETLNQRGEARGNNDDLREVVKESRELLSEARLELKKAESMKPMEGRSPDLDEVDVH
jgi:hypothetical protein